MRTKYLAVAILSIVYLTYLIASNSYAADKLYFGAWGGCGRASTLKDSLKFSIIMDKVPDHCDIQAYAVNGMRAIVFNYNDSCPHVWASRCRYTMWEAEGLSGSSLNLHYDGGTLVNDDSASGGKAMRFSGPGTPRLIQTGPEYYQERENPPDSIIRYTAEFRLKFVPLPHQSRQAVGTAPPVPVCSIMVVDTSHWGIVLKAATIFTTDFAGGGDGYQKFKLEDYTVPGWNQIEFRIYWFGVSGELYVDYAKTYDAYGWQLIDDPAHEVAEQIKAYASQDWVKTVNSEGDTVIYRWYGVDEPSSIDQYMPHRYIDSLLREVSQEQALFQAFNQVDTLHPEKVYEYLLRRDPPELCADIYPMDQLQHDTTGLNYQKKWSDHIKFLNLAKIEAESFKKDFWLFAQAHTVAYRDTGNCSYPLIQWKGTSWCPGFRDPSRYELRLQTFLGLCYGVDGILYFVYYWGSNGDLFTGLYDELYDSTTYKWREIRDFTGPRMKVLGPTYAPLEWQGACLDDVVNSFVLRNSQPSYLDSIRSHSLADEPHWVQVGFFENATADTSYFMMVNRECLETEGANYDVFVTKTGGPYQIRDMYTDSIVGSVSGTGNYFTIYLGPGEGKLLRLEGTGHGTTLFKPPVNYAGVPYYMQDIFAADLDNDGDSDLAVANYYYKFHYTHAVTIFKNRGDGAFDTTASYFPGAWPLSLCAVDYDKDGDNDLAVASYGDHTVSIFENNGSGAFSYLDGISLYHAPLAVISADFNEDGYYDLAVSLNFCDSVAVMINDRYGWFYPVVYYYTGGTSGSDIFAADFNGDTYPDLAIPNSSSHNLSILKNNGNGTFQAPLNYSTGIYPNTICGADLDNDGDCDLVVANQGSSSPPPYPSINIFKNNGNGTFYLASDYVVSGINHIVTADFDLDGDFDLAFTSGTTDSLFVWLNSGDGTFQPAEAHFVGGSWDPLVACDLNGDGAPDLAVGRGYDYDDVAILINLSTNLPPNPFSLISPPDNDTIPLTGSYAHINFQWVQSFDPEGDSLWYALYFSQSPSFRPESTIVHSGLLTTYYNDSLQETDTYYWKVKAYDKWGAPRWSNQIWSLCVKGFIRGDVNNSGMVELGDVVYLISYLYKGGPAPNPLLVGDVNCSGMVELGDVVFLISYLYKGGSAPPC